LRQIGRKEEEAAVFTSPTIGGLYYDRVEQSLHAAGFKRVVRHDIPDGEINKNWEQFTKCCMFLAANFPESSAVPLIVNLGGGVVGDIGGFAAATYRRGLPYVQIPTSLLGDVDCGVGGKVGVNMENAKNILGTFYQPKMVFADLSLLSTLPIREIRSGVAEVIKYGVICDEELFHKLEQDQGIERLVALDPEMLRWVVERCYNLKADIVARDEQDQIGIRNILNYGHTVGHALEMAAKYRFTHGESISIGMVAAAKLAVQLGVCDESVLERSRKLIARAGLPTTCADPDVTVDDILSSMARDKKFSNGKNLFVLATDIGKHTQKSGIEKSLVETVVASCLG
jgi:3-dehydroquinate synthase